MHCEMHQTYLQLRNSVIVRICAIDLVEILNLGQRPRLPGRIASEKFLVFHHWNSWAYSHYHSHGSKHDIS